MDQRGGGRLRGAPGAPLSGRGLRGAGRRRYAGTSGSADVDLGQGSRDAVDRWRTFLDNGVEEYWVLNAGEEPCGLPPRSGLFLTRAEDRWGALPGEGLIEAPGDPVHGLAPLAAGAVRSAVLGCPFEIDAFSRALDAE